MDTRHKEILENEKTKGSVTYYNDLVPVLGHSKSLISTKINRWVHLQLLKHSEILPKLKQSKS